MRFRRHRKGRSRTTGTATVVSASSETAGSENVSVKVQKMPFGFARWLKRIVKSDPNLGYKMVAVFLTLASDNLPMERRISQMNTRVEQIKNIAEVVNNSLQSLKTAAEAPTHIRRLLE